jgi:phage protein D
MNLEAHGREVLLDAQPRTRGWAGVTISEAVRSMLRDAGFADDQLAITETGTRIGKVYQAGRTDAQLLAAWAKRLGWVFYWGPDGVFHFEPRGLDQPPGLVLGFRVSAPGVHPIYDDWSVEDDLTRRPGKVAIAARDPDTKTDVLVEATEATEADRTTLSKYQGTFDPDTGALIVGQAPVGSVGQAEAPAIAESMTAAEAAEVASGRRRDVVQRGVKLSISCPGHPLLAARTVVTIKGLGARLSGPYWVKSVSHSGRAGEWSTRLEVITEGFQVGRGSGAGGDAGALPGKLAELGSAVTADPLADDTVLGALQELQAGAAALPGWDADPTLVLDFAERATRGAQLAAAAGASAAAGAFAEFAAACRSARPIGSDEVSGTPNTQKPEADTGVESKGYYDPETGDFVVSYKPT